MKLDASELKVGDKYLAPYGDSDPIVVTILGERRPHVDRFGRDQWKYWATRADTGKEGWVIFGRGAEVTGAE